MWRFTKIGATNFQSFEELYWEVPLHKPIWVQGENKTELDQDSNGSGKSTIFEIIYYLIIGSSSSGKRDVKLISRWADQSFFWGELYNPFTSQRLRIERTLNRKSSSSLKIILNDEDRKEFVPSITEGNKKIIELIGISVEDLRNFYLINRDKFISFFSSSDSNKRDLITRFSKVTYLNRIPPIIEKEVETESNKVFKLNQEISSIEGSIETSKQNIESIKESCDVVNFEKNKTIRVNLLQNEIENLNKIKQEKLLLQDNLKDKISLLNRQIERKQYWIDIVNKFDYNKKITNLSSSLEEIQEAIISNNNLNNSINKDLMELSKIRTPLEITLQGEVECPNCNFHFVPGDPINIEQAKEIIVGIKEEESELKKEVEKLLNIENNLSKNKLDINSKQRVFINKGTKRNNLVKIIGAEISNLRTELATINSSILSINKELLNLDLSITSKSKDLENEESLVPPNFKSLSDPIKKAIKENENKLVELKEKRDSILKVIENKKTWIINFQSFYIYLTNKVLYNIEVLSNTFLEKIQTRLRLKLEGFKVNADKSIKESITPIILEDGNEEDDYRTYSGGEKGKLILSTILSLHELINISSPSGGLDFLFIDEILDSVDSKGMSNFLKTLETLNKTIFITSHVGTKEINENVLKIVKINGKSSIENC